MPETIDTFVNKLQTEGVEAGQAAADKIRTEAQQQAEQIIKTAQQQADAIITDAKDQAQANLDRNAAELKLAARDTLLRLRGTLSKILQTVLTKRTESQLADPDFLKSLIQEVVTQYARADSTGVQDITINLSEEHRRQLADWAVTQLSQADSAAVDLKGALAQAGFEYTIDGATVEVTVESLVETLAEIINTDLRKMLETVVADGN